MTWFALSDPDEAWFSEFGAAPDGTAPPLLENGPDALVVRGSLVVETRVPLVSRPKPLFFFHRDGAWPLHLSIQALPGGGLTLILDQGGAILHRVFNYTEAGRADILRLTYSWDAPRRKGRLALERAGEDRAQILSIPSPRPFRVDDLRALTLPGEGRYVSPKILFLAATTDAAPVGPSPTLHPEVPIATPHGYRPAGQLRRGDLILTPQGQSVPVLQALTRNLPARGSFAPLRLRAPYFGLRRDIIVAPTQKIVLSGSEVEYLFGKEAVLIQAGHLSGGSAVKAAEARRFVTYTQLLLPAHETLDAAGTEAESLYIGRIRRKPEHLAASVFATLDRAGLPEHALPAWPVLRAYDAATLADFRAA